MSTSAPCLTPIKESPTGERPDAYTRQSWWLLVLLLAAVWLPALNHLRYEWALNEQYRFGFAVPFLAAYLCNLRWTDRPAVSVPWQGWFAQGVSILLLLAMAPLVLAEGANPDWRLLSWTLTGIAASHTLLCIGALGGTRWVGHFAIPVFFVLVAVPWPMRVEDSAIQILMRTNAAIAVEMVHLCGFPAQQSGNLIILGSATVGVDEACSGVRSLQTTLMTGLLLGELYRFSVVRRIGFVILALVVALGWNLLRTLALVAVAANWSTPVMERWHDQIGLAVLVCSLGSVLGLAQLLQWLNAPGHCTPVDAKGVASREGSAMSSVPIRWCWTVIVWVTLVIGGVEIWYRTGSGAKPQVFAWTVGWPPDLAAMRDVPIPHQTWRLMKFTEGSNRTWQDERGYSWSAYYLEWAPGRTAQMLAQVHRPDICLPASGKTLIADRGTRVFTVQGVPFSFRHYVFDDGGRPLQVYFSLQTVDALSEQQGKDLAPYRGLQLANRIALIRERRRNRGQQQLELGVWGIADEDEAADALQRNLERIVVARR